VVTEEINGFWSGCPCALKHVLWFIEYLSYVFWRWCWLSPSLWIMYVSLQFWVQQSAGRCRWHPFSIILGYNSLLYQMGIARAWRYNALYCCVISVPWRWWNFCGSRKLFVFWSAAEVLKCHHITSIWRPNHILSKFFGSHLVKFFKAECSYMDFFYKCLYFLFSFCCLATVYSGHILSNKIQSRYWTALHCVSL